MAASLTRYESSQSVSAPISGQLQNSMARDIRSPSVPYKRDAAAAYKYYNFRSVKRGDLGQAYTIPSVKSNCPWHKEVPPNKEDRVGRTWTKRGLYDQAQCYPRPPKHHRSRRDSWGSYALQKRREGKKECERWAHDDPTMERWDHWIINENVWLDCLGQDEFWEEHYWGAEDITHSYWNQRDPVDLGLLNGPGAVCEDSAAGLSESSMEHRRGTALGQLVDQALWQEEKDSAGGTDRYFADRWETISVTSSFDMVGDCDEDESDDEWADD